MAKFLEKYKKALRDARNEQEVEDVLNKIYQKGFEDGSDEL